MDFLDIIEEFLSLIIVLAVAAFILIFWLLEKRWQENLEKVAKRNWLYFSARLNDEMCKDGYEFLSGFDIISNSNPSLFSTSSKPQLEIKNILIKHNSNLNIRIFEYVKVTGYGKNKHKTRYTCIRGTIKNEFPSFVMRKENIFDKAGALFGFEDIDFERNQEFSKTYFLKSNNQNIKMLFNNDILTFFEREKPDLTIEARGREFLLYKRNRLKRPEDYATLLNYCEKIINKFSDAAEKNSAGKGENAQ
jgi:hypothetical protein